MITLKGTYQLLLDPVMVVLFLFGSMPHQQVDQPCESLVNKHNNRVDNIAALIRREFYDDTTTGWTTLLHWYVGNSMMTTGWTTLLHWYVGNSMMTTRWTTLLHWYVGNSMMTTGWKLGSSMEYDGLFCLPIVLL